MFVCPVPKESLRDVLDNRRSEIRKVNSENGVYDQRDDFIDEPGIVRDVSEEKIGANI